MADYDHSKHSIVNMSLVACMLMLMMDMAELLDLSINIYFAATETTSFTYAQTCPALS